MYFKDIFLRQKIILLFPLLIFLQAPDVMIRKFNPSPTIEDMQQIAAIDKTELKASTLGLQFWVTPDHFDLGKLKVKCRGQIPAVYHMESDNLVVGQHNGPEHKVLQATSTSTSGNLSLKKGKISA